MCIGCDALEYKTQVVQTGVEVLGAAQAMGFEELEARHDNREAMKEVKAEVERGRKRKEEENGAEGLKQPLQAREDADRKRKDTTVLEDPTAGGKAEQNAIRGDQR
jgi:hypothetical protein